MCWQYSKCFELVSLVSHQPYKLFFTVTHKRKQRHKQDLKFGEGHLVSHWRCEDLNLGNLTPPSGLMPHAAWPRSAAARSPVPAAGHCWPMLHSICQQIWTTLQWPQGWKRSVFIPIPKKGNAKQCPNYLTTALISHASKVMLKILQVRLQQYMNQELPDVQAGFRKGRGIRVQMANICWIIKKARVPEKHLLLLYWLRQSFWLCGSQQTVENS